MPTVLLPPSPVAMSLTAPLPSLGMEHVEWPWKSTKALSDWSLAQLHYPLGTIIHDVVDGHPVVAQIQVHDRYGAHPEWGIKLHKGTSVFVPAVRGVTGKLVAVADPPEGWGVDSAVASAGGSPEFSGELEVQRVGPGQAIGRAFWTNEEFAAAVDRGEDPIGNVMRKLHRAAQGSTFGFDLFKDGAKFVSNATKTAGRAIGSASQAVDKATGKVMPVIQKLPVLGPFYHGYLKLNAWPIRAAEDLGRGKSLAQTFQDASHQAASGAHEVAPYAQAVIAVVPGIGPPVSGAISGGLALAEGQPIDEALIAAAAGAIPGGAFIRPAYDLGKAAIQHKDPTQALAGTIAGLGDALGVPVPPGARQALGLGLGIAGKLARGEPVPRAAVQQGIAQLPTAAARQRATQALMPGRGVNVADVFVQEGLRQIPATTSTQQTQMGHALGIGMALASGQALQQEITQAMLSPEELQRLIGVGQAVAARNPSVAAARALLHNVGTQGFDLGAGLMQHSGVTPYQFGTLRGSLDAANRKGFDTAIALHIGLVTTPPLPPSASPRTVAGYALTHGIQGAPLANRASLLHSAVSDAGTRVGAVAALHEIGQHRESWWRRFLEWLGVERPPTPSPL